MRYLYLFILIIISSQINGQALGLAGKPFSVFYTYTSSIRLESIRYDDAVDKPNNYSRYIVGQHGIQLNYAFARIWEAGLSTTYFRDGYGTLGQDRPLFSRNIIVNGYGAHLRRYNLRKGSIAPLGNYSEFAVHLLDVNASLDENSDLFTDPQVYPQLPGLKMVSFTLGAGKNVILFKDFIIGVGYEIGMAVPVNYNIIDLSRVFFSDDYGTPMERMNLFYRGRVKMNIGLAAF